MCVIIASLKGEEISKDHLETGFKSNPHGSGLMVARDGDLILEKGFFKFDDFYDAYLKHKGYPIVIHHRWATTGKRITDNCHPFKFLHGQFNNKLKAGVAHNGHINGHCEIVGASDTLNFVKKRLEPLSIDAKGLPWWKNSGFRWFLEGAIGTNNKLVFLDSDGNTEIYNEKKGEWIKDGSIWASNDTYRVTKFRTDRWEHGWWDDEFSAYHKADKTTKNITHSKPDRSPADNIIDGQFTLAPDLSDDKDILSIEDISPEELEEVDKYLDLVNSN